MSFFTLASVRALQEFPAVNSMIDGSNALKKAFRLPIKSGDELNKFLEFADEKINEFASEQIRVNAVCIGLIKSMQWVRRAGNKDPRELYDEMAKRVPLGRVGEAEEYADLVAFLCSEKATFITGTAINLDGGMCPVV